MLQEKLVTTAAPFYNKVLSLYKKAFPENEIIPIQYLLDTTQGRKFKAYFNANEFCGFASYIAGERIVNITYFAVEEQQRNKGFGSEILKSIINEFHDKSIVVDTEFEDAKTANNAQRIQRKQFYKRNGFSEVPGAYKWQGETYQLLQFGLPITIKDYADFWKGIIGKSWFEEI